MPPKETTWENEQFVKKHYQLQALSTIKKIKKKRCYVNAPEALC
jgi:hypothetical protein